MIVEKLKLIQEDLSRMCLYHNKLIIHQVRENEDEYRHVSEKRLFSLAEQDNCYPVLGK